MCIIQFDWLMSLYLFISLVRNASFLFVKNSGVREELSDVNKLLCNNILFVSLRLCTLPLVHAHPQLTLYTSPTTPSTAPSCARSTISNTWDLAIVGHPTSSQESVKHKSLFTFTFILCTIYKVNVVAQYLERCSPTTDNNVIIAALLQH